MEHFTNRSPSDFVHITRTINTGISYLPLPDPNVVRTPPRTFVNAKDQIEEDFSIYFPHCSDHALSHLLQSQSTHLQRYKDSYQRLCASVLESLRHCVELNEEISHTKHQITYQNELFPILVHNHKLAKQEEKILHNLATKSWQRFDERLQNEIQIQYQIEQLQQQHQVLKKKKMEKEYYQSLLLKLKRIQTDILRLKQEIRSLQDQKDQLQEQRGLLSAQRSYYVNQLDFLRSHLIRGYTSELNNLQLERNSLITQTELIKYNLFEQIQETDTILHHYRTTLQSFRVTLADLEEQLRRQTDDGFQSLQMDAIDLFSQSGFSSISSLMSKDSIDQRRSTVRDNTQRLISIFEMRIEDKQTKRAELEKGIEEYQEKIQRQATFIRKKEEDSATMNELEQQLDDNIRLCREQYTQLKIERRQIESHNHTQIKQITHNDRLNQNLKQQHDSFMVRKRVEEQRLKTLLQRLHPIAEETETLKSVIDQLQRQSTESHQPTLLQLQEKITQLRQIEQQYLHERSTQESTQRTYQQMDEQLKLKTNQTTVRLTKISQRMKTNDRIYQENLGQIHRLETHLTEEQHRYLQWTYQFTTMKNRLDLQRTKQHQIQTQTDIAANQIKHCQNRLKNFDEQLTICRTDLTEQENSLKQLRAFHQVLNEQEEIHVRKLSTGHLQWINLQYRYESSQTWLEQVREQVTKSIHERSILARMLVRRVSLCQLLYRKLSRIEKQNEQRRCHLETLAKCIRSLVGQIRHQQNQHQRRLRERQRAQSEVIRAHLNKINARFDEKQTWLTREIFRKRFSSAHSKLLPTEDFHYLEKKYYLLKNRLIKILCRGIICHLVLVSIQQDFVDHLNEYTSTSHRTSRKNLNSIRHSLYQLMQRLKAKTAENNMLVDYRSYYQLIHFDILQQLKEWTDFVDLERCIGEEV